MPLVHRLTAVIAGVLLLQLSLLGSGTLCTVSGDRTMGTATRGHEANAGMPGMGASGTIAGGAVAVGPQQDDGGTSLPGGCDTHGMNGSCRGPWAPGNCGTTTSCVVSMSAPGRFVGAVYEGARPLPVGA